MTLMNPSDAGMKPRVLVVDDEKRIRDGCHKMLTQEGFDVARAETGAIGLEMIENRHFDIILLDLMMPGLSGFEVLERVKALHPDTAIIVITGYATLEHSIEAMKKGAFDFIPKPFSPQELRIIVGKALEYIRNLQDIANEKSRMRVLINHLTGGVMITDSEKNVALANPAFVRMVGYRGDDVIGRPADDLVKQEQLLQMIDQALKMPAEEFTELNEEIELEDKILGARCVPFRDRIGRTLGTITVLHDITSIKKMDQLKNDFVSMVAHEIRSPMNSVLMQLKVILDGLAGDISEKQSEILGRASLRIRALVALSNELLDLSRIEAGLITQEKEQIDIRPILKEQIAFYQTDASEKSHTLEADLPEHLPPVLANRQNIEEIISNLVSNAIRYTPEGGHIKVGAGIEGNYVHFYVSDTGLGISKEDQEKIFERFFRIKNEKTRYITGTGLGLPIVKSIVEAHNGMIHVDSEEGRGATFKVYIPLIQP